MEKVIVTGKRREHKVFLYTLSTCGWCKKTKQLLNENEVEYEYLDLDTCSLENRKKAARDIKSRGARLAFPIIIIDDEKMIIGYKEDQIREALGI